MGYDPAVHHRRSIRLDIYDYRTPGLYFVTICTQDRALIFGDIVNQLSVLNAAGLMVTSWWKRLPEKFPGVLLEEFVLMPNHFHALLGLTRFPEAGRSGKAARPLRKVEPPPLSQVVRWFKAVTTRAYFRGVHRVGWPAMRDRLWQRNYFEHILRTPSAAHRIATYILENPQHWARDVENPCAVERVPDPIHQIAATDR